MNVRRPDPEGDGNVTVWRLEKLEEQMGELGRMVQQATSALGAQITALSNQLGVGLANLPEHYAPRREAEERHKAISEQFEDVDRRLKASDLALEQRFALRDKGLDERDKAIGDRITAVTKGLEERISANTKLIQRIEGAGWGLAAGLLLALATAALALLKPA